MKFNDHLVISRWKPILEDYERTIEKKPGRKFRFVKDLTSVHHISNKELRRYYRKWIEGGKKDEGLLPSKRGARPGSRRTPKHMERSIIKAYRRFGLNRY